MLKLINVDTLISRTALVYPDQITYSVVHQTADKGPFCCPMIHANSVGT